MRIHLFWALSSQKTSNILYEIVIASQILLKNEPWPLQKVRCECNIETLGRSVKIFLSTCSHEASLIMKKIYDRFLTSFCKLSLIIFSLEPKLVVGPLEWNWCKFNYFLLCNRRNAGSVYIFLYFLSCHFLTFHPLDSVHVCVDKTERHLMPILGFLWFGCQFGQDTSKDITKPTSCILVLHGQCSIWQWHQPDNDGRWQLTAFSVRKRGGAPFFNWCGEHWHE
jgi:hypothetical protein